jgi:hypothetical protein
VTVNSIAMARGITGMQIWVPEDGYFDDPTITFTANRYEVARRARLFEWRGARLTLRRWRALGHG